MVCVYFVDSTDVVWFCRTSANLDEITGFGEGTLHLRACKGVTSMVWGRDICFGVGTIVNGRMTGMSGSLATLMTLGFFAGKSFPFDIGGFGNERKGTYLNSGSCSQGPVLCPMSGFII